MQKDQRDFYKFSKEKFEWEKKLNEWNYNDEVVLVFPDHILGELNEQGDQPLKEDKLKEKKKKSRQCPLVCLERQDLACLRRTLLRSPEREKNPKQVENGVMTEEATEKENNQKASKYDEDSVDEDARTLKDLLAQAAKDKKEMKEEVLEKVKGKKVLEEDKSSEDNEEEE